MTTSPIFRVVVDSSSIASVGYSTTEAVLDVEFRNGSIYRYFDVPAHIYDELRFADSKGRLFNRAVRDQFRHVRVHDRAGDSG